MTLLQIVGLVMLIFGAIAITIILRDPKPLEPSKPTLVERVGLPGVMIGGLFFVLSWTLWFVVGFLLLAARVSVS